MSVVRKRDLESALWQWHGRDFPQNWSCRWDELIPQLFKVYDELGMWHVVPEQYLSERESWRKGERKARFRYDRETDTWYEDDQPCHPSA